MRRVVYFLAVIGAATLSVGGGWATASIAAPEYAPGTYVRSVDGYVIGSVTAFNEASSEYMRSLNELLLAINDSRSDLRAMAKKIESSPGRVLLFRRLGMVYRRAATRIRKLDPPAGQYQALDASLEKLALRTARLYQQIARAYRDYDVKRYASLGDQLDVTEVEKFNGVLHQLDELRSTP